MKARWLVVGLFVLAVTAPLAAAQDDGVLVIRGGRVHTLAGDEAAIDAGVVVIRAGRIVAVGGPDTTVPAGADVIDATGLEVLPGFFDAVTRLGLTEIGAVAVTSDFRELGDNNPHLQGITAVHPASEIIPVSRANGITHAVASPAGSGIAGQGSLIHLDGWTVEEMVIDPGVYMSVQWPSLQTRGFNRATFTAFNRTFAEAKEQYETAIGDLEALLGDARRYAAAAASGDLEHRDLKLEALARAASGELPLLIATNSERGIRDAIAFAERTGVDIVIAGGTDAWKVADLLAEKDVPVILGPTQSLPRGPDDPYDTIFAAPGKLQAAGVRFAISSFNASSARNLPYEAANAVPFGLSHRDALKAITANPAEILGFGDELGTLEAGKIANIIVTDGDPLEIQTQLVHLIINGRITSTDNKHQDLYEKYRARPRR